MKRLFTLIICTSFLQVVKANFVQSVALTAADTTELLPVAQVAVSPYQNVIYKRRLDSIRKDVQLDYNQYVQSYIDTYMSRRNEMGLIIGRSKYYFPIYEKAFREAGIPDEIKYLSIVESALNPAANSRVGAAGPWQFMSETAKIYGLKMNDYVDERRDPVQASYAAAAYLRDAYQQFGDWLLAIASYNCGKSNVTKALEQSGAHDYWSIRQLLPAETRGYVPAFIAVNYVMNYYNRHGIPAYACQMFTQTDTVTVSKLVPLSKIAQVLGITMKDAIALNPSYKQLIVNGSAKEPRSIIIPQISKLRYAALTQVLTNPDGPVPVVREQPPVFMASAQPNQIPMSAINQAMQTPSAGSIQANGKTLPAWHITQKGDTFNDIAAKYGVKVDDLLKMNLEFGNSKTVQLQPGLSIRITRG
ncbi:LysM peptidoglycan-binding domain-containing protein [Mucilaginibacter pallidiroseus]|uniref:LysM peptidoglycan-binding domain-containing protein n=1 Tax=Mucilaginibacter pallidiroseus TaxID=2599295 RepID=A0A563UGI1_9SPHI|nr:lytic transglycosylase domain-containing protein [Mucilaginibacter pallidiroseus]TWR30492.1 LysM peptidoglycan-binding domain-containing protein [Mucilaginibacter pallidiroseus]